MKLWQADYNVPDNAVLVSLGASCPCGEGTIVQLDLNKKRMWHRLEASGKLIEHTMPPVWFLAHTTTEWGTT